MQVRKSLPPPLELRCLQALWVLGEANVRDVQLALEDRKLAYTTVMTVLDRLVRRGGVERRKTGRAFIYVPVLSRDCVRSLAIKELVDSFFGGSPEALREYLDCASPVAFEVERDSNDESSLDAALL